MFTELMASGSGGSESSSHFLIDTVYNPKGNYSYSSVGVQYTVNDITYILTGTFTPNQSINIGDVIFQVSPAPLTSVSFKLRLGSSSDVRNCTINTDGNVVFNGSGWMASGYTWNIEP